MSEYDPLASADQQMSVLLDVGHLLYVPAKGMSKWWKRRRTKVTDMTKEEILTAYSIELLTAVVAYHVYGDPNLRAHYLYKNDEEKVVLEAALDHRAVGRLVPVPHDRSMWLSVLEDFDYAVLREQPDNTLQAYCRCDIQSARSTQELVDRVSRFTHFDVARYT